MLSIGPVAKMLFTYTNLDFNGDGKADRLYIEESAKAIPVKPNFTSYTIDPGTETIERVYADLSNAPNNRYTRVDERYLQQHNSLSFRQRDDGRRYAVELKNIDVSLSGVLGGFDKSKDEVEIYNVFFNGRGGPIAHTRLFITFDKDSKYGRQLRETLQKNSEWSDILDVRNLNPVSADHKYGIYVTAKIPGQAAPDHHIYVFSGNDSANAYYFYLQFYPPGK